MKPRIVAVDLDGVIYFGNSPVADANVAIKRIRKMDIRIAFVTNNSRESRSQIQAKLGRFDIDANMEDIYAPASAIGFLLRRIHDLEEIQALVIGSEDFKNELSSLAMEIVDSPHCDYVIVALDREFDYIKLSKAMNALQNGARLIVCNRDRRVPVENGNYLPACGAIAIALEYASEIEAQYEVGKPDTLFLEMIASNFGAKPWEILVVGDGLESDVLMANRYGSPSVWISHDRLPRGNDAEDCLLRPTFALKSITDLPSMLENEFTPNVSPWYPRSRNA